MNWDVIGGAAEILAAIGVIASLVYLAIQIRHSREQTLQNTKAIEAQVIWAHFGASRDIYLSRVPETKRGELLNDIRTWDQAGIEEVEKQDVGYFTQACYLVGNEFNYWQSRYLTQSSSEERKILHNHIKVNGAWPMYRVYWDRISSFQPFYRADFSSFVEEVFSALDAN